MRFLRLPLASIRHYATVSPYPISLRPSIHEIQSGRLTKKNVQAGLEAFQRDGVVVLENVVHHRAIDKLNATMQEDAKILLARGEDG